MGRPKRLAAGALLLLLPESFVDATIRGVAPEDQQKYPQGPGSSFGCLKEKKEVPFESVNDNYCDCSDGSDEPGTGACSGQEETLFYCPNAGGTPQLVYASRVGDGICDCCDGSDEADLLERRPNAAKACPNTCVEDGEREKQEREKKLADLREGVKSKEETIEKARKEISDAEAELKVLEEEIPKLEKVVEQAKAKKEEAEAIRFQKDCKTEMPRLRDEVTTLKARIKELEQEVENLKPKEEKKEEKKVVSEYAKWMENAEEEITKDGDEAVADALAEDDSAPSAYTTTTTTADSSKTAEEIQLEEELSTAETAVKEKKDSKRDSEKKINLVPQEYLGYYDLADKCLEFKTTEYTYKLCFFNDAKQDYTQLGRWEGFKGPKEALFSDGAMCYGGPARSLKVVFECGAEQIVTDLFEPSRCAYQATVKHPGACDLADASALEKPPVRHPKDEL
eukprot:TRINITY_DN17801_c0_g1_i1.p1 TRINITY_DN17801_c0_g1~~TRINITY_DN17801_c0_g1_i1.p1  ORF type:complete len:453 (-),score=139.72 TRINITY_DN17801_c0_g1_i1:83-1441(-)